MEQCFKLKFNYNDDECIACVRQNGACPKGDGEVKV